MARIGVAVYGRLAPGEKVEAIRANCPTLEFAPFEAESALLDYPAVAESAVVASPDEMRGAIVKVFVVLEPGYQASPALATDLQEHVKQLTAPYKYPREIAFVTALPKTISGKIRRIELRQREIARKAHGGQRTQAF